MSDKETIALVYDHSEDPASVEKVKLTMTLVSHTYVIEAVQVLVGIGQGIGKFISVLADRDLVLSIVAYTQPLDRNYIVVQAQLSVYYIDTLYNHFKWEEVTRRRPGILEG